MSIQTIPQDIAQEIFTHCLSHPPSLDDKHPFPSPPHPNDAPLLLRRVCRTWRHLALRTPQLWTGLSIDTSKLPESLQDSAAFRNFVAEWFSRAGSLPLSFSASGSQGFAKMSLAVEVIDPFKDRIQTLRLAGDCWTHERIRALGAFPILATLVVR
ncbi:hypothetical protein C8F01DRAFT_1173825, partial [Mycena amicta]